MHRATSLPRLLSGLLTLLACSSPQHPLPTVLLVSGTPASVSHEHAHRGLNPGDRLRPEGTLVTPDDALLVVSYGDSGFALLPGSRARLLPARHPPFGLELLEGAALLSYGPSHRFPLVTTTATLQAHTAPTYAIVRSTPSGLRLRIYQGSLLVRSEPVSRTDTLTLTASSPPVLSTAQEPEAELLPIGPSAFRLRGASTVQVSSPIPSDLFLDDTFLTRLPASFLIPDDRPHRLLVRAARHKDIATNLPPDLPKTVFWNPLPILVAETDEALAASPGPAIAVGGTLLFAVPPSGLEALDMASRTRLWRTALPGFPSSLLFHTGHIVMPTPSHIVCLRADSGRILWTVRTASPATDLVTVGDLVCYAEHGGLIHSRSLRDGTLAWSFRTLKPPLRLLLVDSKTLVAITENGLVLAVDPSTGTLLWQTSAGRRPSSAPPALLDGRVLIPCRDGHLVLVDRHRRPRVVKTGLDRDIRGLAATASAVVVASADGDLLGLDAVHLSRRWRRKGSERPTLLTHGPEGHLYAGFTDGTLMRLSPATGEPLETVTYPAAIRGLVFSGRETFVLTGRGLYTF